MRKAILSLLAAALLLAVAAGVWVQRPMGLDADVAEFTIPPGAGARAVADLVTASGAQANPWLLYAWFRLSGQSRQIRAGSYELDRQASPASLLDKLVRGEESLRSITLVEGWTFAQVRQALARADHLQATTQGLAAADIMQRLGRPGVAAEGRFFPDTYRYAKNSTDLALLERAAAAMDRELQQAWAQRSAQTPLRNAEQALILASIVEKETGVAEDRPMIASVFSNRLRIGMRLQTDPTVIYGMGEQFDGNLRRADLERDTPWNTYTRAGLPPTPIAMPGRDSLRAAVQPAESNAFYFVARGDGSSQFSATLQEHNQAVNKYQRGQ